MSSMPPTWLAMMMVGLSNFLPWMSAKDGCRTSVPLASAWLVTCMHHYQI